MNKATSAAFNTLFAICRLQGVQATGPPGGARRSGLGRCDGQRGCSECANREAWECCSAVGTRSCAARGGPAEQNGGPGPQQGTNLPEALAWNPHERVHMHTGSSWRCYFNNFPFSAPPTPPTPLTPDHSCVHASRGPHLPNDTAEGLMDARLLKQKNPLTVVVQQTRSQFC